jgi:hypothetical protein
VAEAEEGWGRLLATLHVHDSKALIPLVLDMDLGEFVGHAALNALWTLHLKEKISLEEFRAELGDPLVNDFQSGIFTNVGLIEDVVLEVKNILGPDYHQQQRLYFSSRRKVASDDSFIWREPSAQPYIREAPKVGRNDPCPCGSGKKYKKCCGK